MSACDPDALGDQAKCFMCVPPGALAAVRVYLWCAFANAIDTAIAENPTNLLEGQNYGGQLLRLSFLAAVKGTRYRIIWGTNDKAMDSGASHLWTPSPGATSFIITSSTTMNFYGFAAGPVTAKLYVA